MIIEINADQAVPGSPGACRGACPCHEPSPPTVDVFSLSATSDAGYASKDALAAFVDSYHDALPPRSRAMSKTHGADSPPCSAPCSAPGWRGLVRRAAGPLGGRGDVAEHPAEYHAVERRYGPPVGVSGEPARLEDSPLAVGGHAVMVSAGRQLEPGQARQFHLGTQPQQR